MLGAEGETNFAGNSMPAGRMFDAAAGGAKCVAPRIPFEMDAQQPWVHGELRFPR